MISYSHVSQGFAAYWARVVTASVCLNKIGKREVSGHLKLLIIFHKLILDIHVRMCNIHHYVWLYVHTTQNGCEKLCLLKFSKRSSDGYKMQSFSIIEHKGPCDAWFRRFQTTCFLLHMTCRLNEQYGSSIGWPTM